MSDERNNFSLREKLDVLKVKDNLPKMSSNKNFASTSVQNLKRQKSGKKKEK